MQQPLGALEGRRSLRCCIDGPALLKQLRQTPCLSIRGRTPRETSLFSQTPLVSSRIRDAMHVHERCLACFISSSNTSSRVFHDSKFRTASTLRLPDARGSAAPAPAPDAPRACENAAVEVPSAVKGTWHAVAHFSMSGLIRTGLYSARSDGGEWRSKDAPSCPQGFASATSELVVPSTCDGDTFSTTGDTRQGGNDATTRPCRRHAEAFDVRAAGARSGGGAAGHRERDRGRRSRHVWGRAARRHCGSLESRLDRKSPQCRHRR